MNGFRFRFVLFAGMVLGGIDLDKIIVPACLPDHETVRSDLADYLWEVQRFDREVGVILTRLQSMGELDNTIVVVSGDNGMPFPRCKATLYDLGTRVPLAIRWGANVPGGRQVSDFVSLCDLAPTFLEAAGLKPPGQMTGRSLLSLLSSDKSGRVEPDRSYVLTGVERHVYMYPRRALRTDEFLLIKNSSSDEWPTGEVAGKNPVYDFAKTPWPTERGAFSFAIDPSPTKQFLRHNRDSDRYKRFAALSFSPRPAYELYDLAKDPQQLNNVAEDPSYAVAFRRLRRQLAKRLLETKDPRSAVSQSGTRAGLTAIGAVNDDGPKYQVKKPPAKMSLPDFYAKYVDASGYPVVSSAKVNDYALKEAAYLIDMMLAERPDIRKAMVASGSRMIVMAHNEFTTDVPEHSHLRPKEYWDKRARGLGGSRTDPVCSSAEENLLAMRGDPYSTENILIHEFAHNMHLRGLVNTDPTFDKRLKQAYDRAMEKGLWKGKYAATNHAEYFAEGVQSWFNNNRPPDHDHNHVDTREELQEYDPGLAAICAEVFGKTKLEYTKPATRLKDHLEGYDPTKAPRFQWPDRLQRKKKRTRSADKRGDG